MTIKLLPKSIKNLKEMTIWVDKNILDTDTVIGIRYDCKITRIKEFSYVGPRWNKYRGISIYYNF